MKPLYSLSLSLGLAGALALATGCDWSSGGGASSFNTSQGAGVNVNWSGVYSGLLSGGRAVGVVGGNITRLVISQGGNGVEVTDNTGATYQGSVGSPGAVSQPDPTTGAFPAGAELATSQISFGSDLNGVQFVGILHAVTVEDIQGDSTIVTDTSTDSSSDTQGGTVTSTFEDGETITSVTTVTIDEGDGFVSVTETTVVTDKQTGAEISRTVNTTRSRNTTATTTTENTFRITEANTQFRLEGTWIDPTGVFQVDAISRGNASSSVTTTSTSSSTSTTPTTTTP